MRQTEKYKFNIIETSDAFSPDALNENARAAETQLAALAAADAALASTHATDKAALEKTSANNKAALEQSIASTKSTLEQSIASTKSTLEQSIASTKTALEQSIANAKSTLSATDTANKTALEQSIASTKSALEQSIASTKSALQTAIGSGGKTARIKWGSYVGNGNFGKSNPNSLTFDFKPHFVAIVRAETTTTDYLVRDAASSAGSRTWGDKQVTWYASNNASGQMNVNGATYYYVAIGESL